MNHKRNCIKTGVLTIMMFLIPVISMAGNLEPTAAPGSTMHTLEELYAKQAANEAKIDALTETLNAFIGGTNRFLDMQNGTVKDMRTGLIWLKNANCYGAQTWDAAMEAVSELGNGACGLSDGSVQGQWRLPTMEELQGIGTDPPTARTTLGYPLVTWTTPAEPFLNVQPSPPYWSGTPELGDYVWFVYMNDGYVDAYRRTNSIYVWPVR